MTPRVSLVHLLVIVAIGAALSGCGGSEDAPSPKLPAALANDLARQSEAIAASIDSGDGCRAADQARSLQRAVERAIAANDVPPPLQRPLRVAINRLVRDVAPLCEPPAPQGDDEEVQRVSCDALEAQKKALEERRKEIEEVFKEDKDERERRKKAIEEQKKALEEERRTCREES